MSATATRARFLADTTPEQVPEAVLHEGKRCLINFVAVALFASKDPSLRILLDVFRLEGARKHATLVGAIGLSSDCDAFFGEGDTKDTSDRIVV